MKKNTNNNKYQVFVLKNTTKAKTEGTIQNWSLNNSYYLQEPNVQETLCLLQVKGDIWAVTEDPYLPFFTLNF